MIYYYHGLVNNKAKKMPR